MRVLQPQSPLSPILPDLITSPPFYPVSGYSSWVPELAGYRPFQPFLSCHPSPKMVENRGDTFLFFSGVRLIRFKRVATPCFITSTTAVESSEFFSGFPFISASSAFVIHGWMRSTALIEEPALARPKFTWRCWQRWRWTRPLLRLLLRFWFQIQTQIWFRINLPLTFGSEFVFLLLMELRFCQAISGITDSLWFSQPCQLLKLSCHH